MDSYRITRVPHYSGYHYLKFAYSYGTITLYGLSFQTVLIHLSSNIVALQPQNCRNKFGLGYSAFARHYLRNHYCFLFLRLLRCFSSPGSPPRLRRGYHVFNMMGCPIGKSPDQRLFAPPRSLSQLITSFIASESLGIRRTLLLTFLTYFLIDAFAPAKNLFYFLSICQ